MANRFFLCGLREKGRKLAVPENTLWRQNDSFLEQFARDIFFHEQIQDPRVMQSIPSVFARQIQWDRAFHLEEPEKSRGNAAKSDDRHPLHDAVIQEWRGLLALIALRKWLSGVEITAVEFDLAKEFAAALRNRQATGTIGDLNLLTILFNQLPSPQELWGKWWLFYCNNCLIGATSPWTLVFTPADYACPEVIPWRSDKHVLIDPLRHYRQTDNRIGLQILSRWIELVLEKFPPAGMNGVGMERRVGNLRRELTAWKMEVDLHLRKFGEKPGDIPVLLEMDVLVKEEPYRLITSRPKHSDGFRSDLLLTSRAGNSVIALAREGLSENWTVYGAVLAGAVDVSRSNLAESGGPAGWRTGRDDGQTIPLPYLMVDDAFLPEKLLELPLTDAALTVGANNVTVPLTPLFFEYFTLEDLLNGERVLLECFADQNYITVKLTIPVSSSRLLQVTKTYDRKTQVVSAMKAQANSEPVPPPVVAFWPDFVSENWPDNLAAVRIHQRKDCKTPIIARPLLSNGESLEPSDQGSEKIQIWFDRQPLIGFAIYEHRSTAGLLLRRKLRYPEPAEAGKKWEVAVDFGTSNTICARIGANHEMEPLSLIGRTLSLTDLGKEQIRFDIENELYPLSSSIPPLPTLLGKRGSVRRSSETNSLDTHHAWFDLPIQMFRDNSASLSDRLCMEVKWKDEQAETSDAPLRQYLRAITRGILAEAVDSQVSEVELHWSCPMALREGTRNNMANFWSSAGSRYGHLLKFRASAKGVFESEAICRALASRGILPAKAGELSIAVDVGGGSSDVGIWTEGGLQDQLSVKLAANDVLRNMCQSNSAFRREIRVFYEGGKEEKAHKGSEGSADLLVKMCNIWLSRYSGDPCHHPLVSHLFSQANPSAHPWLGARTLAFLLYSGLFFYLGLRCGRFVADRSGQEPHIKLYMGGRGSLLLPWISNIPEDLSKVMAEAFRVGVEAIHPRWEPRIEIKGPTFVYDHKILAAKEEVVRGLLSDYELNVPHEFHEDSKRGTMIGERGWRKHRDTPELEWFDQVSLVDLTKLVPPASFSTSFIATFWSEVVCGLGRKFGLDTGIFESMDLDSCRGEITEMLRDSQRLILQPVFFYELKVLMERYLQQGVQ